MKGKYNDWLTDDGLVLIEGWARDGLSEEKIAHNMGISRSTLKEWKKKYPAISANLKKGREVVDYYVENALVQAALNGNVTAQIYWLKNRRPDKWKDKVETVQNITFEDDGFLDALRGDVKGTFDDSDDIES